jgi:RNA polymerase sigma factor (sigma-70 family)
MKQIVADRVYSPCNPLTLLWEGWITDFKLRAFGSGLSFLGKPMIDRAKIDAALALVVQYHETFTDEEAERLEDAFGLEGFSLERVQYAECEQEFTTPTAEETYAANARNNHLRAALQHLTQRQADVIELRFGLTNGREYTQEQVAAMLGISQPGVARHEAAALRKMHKLLADVI